MRLNDMLACMRTKNRTKFAGQLVRDEIGRTGVSQAKAADQMHMAPSTLARIIAGDDKVSEVKYRSVEALLSLPDHLLSYIVEGHRESIEAIGDDEMRPGLRRIILSGLDSIQAEGIEGVGGEANNG